jgi:hypothetical protein
MMFLGNRYDVVNVVNRYAGGKPKETQEKGDVFHHSKVKK